MAVLSWFGISTATSTSEIQEAERQSRTELAAADIPAVDGAVSITSSLWDDPYAFVDSPQVQEQTKPVNRLAESIRLKIGDDGKLLILVASLPGGNSPEDYENRKRRRHAVELALANLGFTLSYPDRMTFRKLEYDFHFGPRQQAEPLFVKRAVALPTKLYKHYQDNSHILLTWLKDSDLGSQPIHTIRSVVAEFATLKDQSAFCLLGPAWSDTMEQLLQDGIHATKQEEEFFSDWKYGTAVCNIVCTAPDESLGLKPGQTYVPIGQQKSMKLIHTIASDEKLLKVLKHELEVRGVVPRSNNSNQMVLFVEESSRSYIQSLQQEFTSGYANPIIIPYLKGIAASQDNAQAAVQVDDYLDRSLKEISRLSSARSIRTGNVRAVGIFGSLWQDKNLILQKARNFFPVATFFTTELDARYTAKDVVQNARNLVVASHYGLWIRGGIDEFRHVERVPSFRDGYQTSAFVGTSVLGFSFLKEELTSDEFRFSTAGNSQDLFNLVGRTRNDASSYTYLRPTIFEVGNNSAIQLRTAANSTQANDLPFQQPDGATSINRRTWLLVILAIVLVMSVLVFNFLAPYSADARQLKKVIKNAFQATWESIARFTTGRPGNTWIAVWPMILALAVFAAMFVLMFISDAYPDSEPILFGDGISIWPSLFGLYIVIALCLREMRNLFRNEEGYSIAPHNYSAISLAAIITLGFYGISYFESGWIIPPARDHMVRGFAHFILFVSTYMVLFVTVRCLLQSLEARQDINEFRRQVNSDSIFEDDDFNFLGCCRKTMQLSIDSSHDLIGPAIISILYVVSRWPGWDRWGLDISWFVLFTVPIATCLFAALVVRLTAIDFRSRLLDRLRTKKYDFAMSDAAGAEDEVTELELAIDEIAALNRGPFGPITRDYLLGAAALVFAVAFTGPAGLLLNQLLVFIG